MAKPRHHLSLVMATLTLGGGLYYLHPAQTKTVLVSKQPGQIPVAAVIDGDTIMVKSGSNLETVRLIGVDTPETKDPRKPVQCFGEAAHRKTAELIGKSAVRLEADPTNSDRDKYHRLLRYVYLPDGRLLNAELIRQGYGFAYTVFPFKKLDQFRYLEESARADNLGLWAGCGVDDSKQIKQTAFR